MKTQDKPSKKKFVSDAFKLMIAAGSMAGTVGIWTQFANQEVIQASADTETTAVNFQPLPTVVPLTQVSSTNNNTVDTSPTDTTTAVRDVTVDTTVQNNSSSTVSNSNNNVITLSAPAPVTSTRSSRR
jgi:cytoskeletal protein RodZ